MMPKILIPKILQPDRTLFFIVKIDQGSVYPDPTQKVGDRNKSSVLPSIDPVLNQDERSVRSKSNAIIFSIRTSLFNGVNIEGPVLVVGKSLPGFDNQGIQAHTKSYWSKTPSPTSRPATMHPVSSTRVRMIEFGQAIALRSFASLSIKELGPTQLSSLISAPGLTLAPGAIEAGQSASAKYAGRHPSRAMTRWSRKYSDRFPTLNQRPSSNTAPPTRPPRRIQSTRTGIKEIF